MRNLSIMLGLAVLTATSSSAQIPLDCNRALYHQAVLATTEEWAVGKGFVLCGHPRDQAVEVVKEACLGKGTRDRFELTVR